MTNDSQPVHIQVGSEGKPVLAQSAKSCLAPTPNRGVCERAHTQHLLRHVSRIWRHSPVQALEGKFELTLEVELEEHELGQAFPRKDGVIETPKLRLMKHE